MALSHWFMFRQARESIAHGRPEEAHRIIEPLLAENYRSAWRIARELVSAYAARAERHLDSHHPDAAWRELLAAESLNTGDRAAVKLRQTLTRLGLVEVRACLEAGSPVAAAEAAARLADRGVRHPDLGLLQDAARDWCTASAHADRGDFARALADLDRLPLTLFPTAGLDRFRDQIRERGRRFKAAIAQLHESARTRAWQEALEHAEEALAVAPEHRESRDLKTEAWQAVHPASTAIPREEPVGPIGAASTRPIRNPLGPGSRAEEPPAAVLLPKRFLLWIDGPGGGHLVCLSTRVTFGQAGADGPVDVPVRADISRLHAEVLRDGEGYVLESGRGILLNDSPATRAVLAVGDRVTLGPACQFRYQRPVRSSLTARLELTSGHRLQPAVNSVLLMANELIIGPGPEAHVLLPRLTTTVSIYRSRDGLSVRIPKQAYRIDDEPAFDRAALPFPSRVVSDEITFAVEPVGPRG